MSDEATFHAAFEGCAVTVRINYRGLEQGQGVAQCLAFEWEGQRTNKIIPQYVAWMHTVLSEVAKRVNKRILYAFPATDGHGHQFYGYEPDGTHRRMDS